MPEGVAEKGDPMTSQRGKHVAGQDARGRVGTAGATVRPRTKPRTKNRGSRHVWPNFIAPEQYPDRDCSTAWEDPRLPDFERIWAVARANGYAVGLHGSMRRDCDLIAVPWVAKANPVMTLVDDLCRALDARIVGDIEQKPCGRVAMTLQIDAYVKPIDLSVFLPPSGDQ